MALFWPNSNMCLKFKLTLTNNVNNKFKTILIIKTKDFVRSAWNCQRFYVQIDRNEYEVSYSMVVRVILLWLWLKKKKTSTVGNKNSANKTSVFPNVKVKKLKNKELNVIVKKLLQASRTRAMLITWVAVNWQIALCLLSKRNTGRWQTQPLYCYSNLSHIFA